MRASFKAAFSVDFYDGFGNHLGVDASPNLFSNPVGCAGPNHVQQVCGYRRNVGGIPSSTRSIRFTATITDLLYMCNNQTLTVASFKNGFDNLWLQIGYAGLPSAGFRPGPAPGPSVKVQLAPAAPARPR